MFKPHPRFNLHAVGLAVVLVTTLLVFLPAAGGDFVNWDDDENFLHNERYRGFDLGNLLWMFTESHLGHYQPLTWITLAADHACWGMNPIGYHLTSVLIHALNAGLVYVLITRLLGRTGTTPFAAAIGALFFSVHPLRAESVAWITERRDVVSGFLLLLTVIAYVRAVDRRGAALTWRRWYALSLGAFAASLLAKAWGITIPVVLLLMDMYVRRESSGVGGRIPLRRLLAEKIPFAALAVAAAGIAALSQTAAGAARSLSDYPIASRLMQAAFGLFFYPLKTLLPTNLSPLYQIDASLPPTAPIYVFPAMAVVAISISLFVLRRRWPACFAAWAIFVVIVSPVLGLFQSGSQLVADRYTYLACIPFAVLVSAVAQLVRRSAPRGRGRSLTVAVPAVVIVVLSGLTYQQCGIWKNSVSLWSRALARDPGSDIAHVNMGAALEQVGRTEEALGHYECAVSANPENSDAHHNLARVHALAGADDRAETIWRRLLARDPMHADALCSLGAQCRDAGRWREAASYLERSVRSDARQGRAWELLGETYAKQGRLEEALACLRNAVALRPRRPEARYNLGLTCLRLDLRAEAKAHFRATLALAPPNPDLLNQLGRAFLILGNRRLASVSWRQALSIEPGHRRARSNLAKVSDS